MIPDGVRRLARSRLVENAFALSTVHMVTLYVLPLLTVPYLTRVLGPTEWGRVAFFQGFAAFLIKFVEYGFNFSGSREVARHRESPEHLGRMLSSVLGAKTFLALVALGPVAILYAFLPQLHDHPTLLLASLFYGTGLAFDLTWYYQGLESLRMVSVLNISTKMLSVLAILTLVQGPEDAWMVLTFQGGASWVAMIAALSLAYRKVPVSPLRREFVVDALRKGRSLFVFNASISLYTVGNSFILGLFAPPAAVGFYAAADKLARALAGLLEPVSRAIYPRVSYLIARDSRAAARLVRKGMIVLGGGAAVVAVAVVVAAPMVVDVVFGPRFGASVPILRLLALRPLIMVPGIVLGIHWMLPLGLDRQYNRFVISAGLLNVALAVFLAPPFEGLGMAISVLASQALVSAGVYLWLTRKDMDPFKEPYPIVASASVRSETTA